MDKEDVIVKLKVFNKPAIIINGEGIIIGKCFVNWDEIKDYSVVKTAHKSFMLIFVDEPQHFVNEVSWISKWRMRLNMRKYRTPLRISTFLLQCSFDEYGKVIAAPRPEIESKSSILETRVMAQCG